LQGGYGVSRAGTEAGLFEINGLALGVNPEARIGGLWKDRRAGIQGSKNGADRACEQLRDGCSGPLAAVQVYCATEMI
jgi:hypothetical protein